MGHLYINVDKRVFIKTNDNKEGKWLLPLMTEVENLKMIKKYKLTKISKKHATIQNILLSKQPNKNIKVTERHYKLKNGKTKTRYFLMEFYLEKDESIIRDRILKKSFIKLFKILPTEWMNAIAYDICLSSILPYHRMIITFEKAGLQKMANIIREISKTIIYENTIKFRGDKEQPIKMDSNINLDYICENEPSELEYKNSILNKNEKYKNLTIKKRQLNRNYDLYEKEEGCD